MSAVAPSLSRERAAALCDPRAVGAVYLGLLAIMLAPALIWPIPRTTDLVAHWARLTLLTAGAGDPVRAFYSVRFGLIPNLGVDLLYLALAPFLSAQSVARIAYALSLLLPAWGAWRLHRALFGQPSPTIWLAPLMSYNLATTGGLVNYAFGMGLALLALAFAAERPQRIFPRDLIALNLFATALFFCHLIALAAFALLLGLMEAAPRPGETGLRALRRAAWTPAYVAAGLALTLLREPTPATYALDGSKMAMLLAPVASMTGADAFALAALLVLAAAAFSRGLFVAPSARLALAGFGLAALAAPPAHGAANLIDARLAVLWAYFAVPVVSVRDPIGLARTYLAAVLIVAAMRVNAAIPAWRAYDDAAAVMRDELRALPLGARALVVAPTDCHDADMPLIAELAVFATIDRRAFTNVLFAQAGMQPVAARDPALAGAPTIAMDERWLTPTGRAALGERRTSAPWARAFIDWRRHFDTLIEVHGACPGAIALPGLEAIARSRLAEVYRIVPGPR